MAEPVGPISQALCRWGQLLFQALQLTAKTLRMYGLLFRAIPTETRFSNLPMQVIHGLIFQPDYLLSRLIVLYRKAAAPMPFILEQIKVFIIVIQQAINGFSITRAYPW